MPQLTLPAQARPLPGRTKLIELGGETMGTTWSVKMFALPVVQESDVCRAVQAALDQVIEQMSPWEPLSDISRFASEPAGTWQNLPQEFLEVLDCALAMARMSGGAFDPTLGPLVDTWGFGPGPARSRAPPDEAIRQARARGGWTRVEIDRERGAVLQPGGFAIDLCGIAKGFAVDHVAARLKYLGVRDMLVEIGGELRGEGVKPDGSPWWVVLEQPTNDATGAAQAGDTLVALHGLSVATSGDFRRCFQDRGRRYSHTIDPRSGEPVIHDLACVSVLDSSCMKADALATVFMVLGPAEGMRFARAHDIAALFSLRRPNGIEQQASPALEAMLD